MGSCACPLTKSLVSFADLRDFQGFFLNSDTRENDRDRFNLVSSAFAGYAMVGISLHCPWRIIRLKSHGGWSKPPGRPSWRLFGSPGPNSSLMSTTASLSKSKMPLVGRSLAGPLSGLAVLVLRSTSLDVRRLRRDAVLRRRAPRGRAVQPCSESRSLSAFCSLDSFLPNCNSLTGVAGMDSSTSPAARCAALVAHVTEERRNRSAGGAQAAPAEAPAPSAASGASTESAGTIFNNLVAYGDVIEYFLRSSVVTAPLVWLTVFDEENNESQVVGDLKSGLAVLFSRPDVRNTDDEILRLEFLRYSQVINQFLAIKRQYRNPLFTRLALARESIVWSLSSARLSPTTAVTFARRKKTGKSTLVMHAPSSLATGY